MKFDWGSLFLGMLLATGVQLGINHFRHDAPPPVEQKSVSSSGIITVNYGDVFGADKSQHHYRFPDIDLIYLRTEALPVVSYASCEGPNAIDGGECMQSNAVEIFEVFDKEGNRVVTDIRLESLPYFGTSFELDGVDYQISHEGDAWKLTTYKPTKEMLESVPKLPEPPPGMMESPSSIPTELDPPPL